MKSIKLTDTSNTDGTKKFAVFITLLVVVVSFPFLIRETGLKGGILSVIVFLAIPSIYAIVIYPKFGIITLLVASYLLAWFMRMDLTTFPLGTIIDGILALLLLGFLIKQKYRQDWWFIKTPISIMILIWLFYNLLQVLNPAAESRLAWLYTIRSSAIVMLSYFIFSYHIREKKTIRLILKIWLALGFFAALYATKQQYWGFFAFEERAIYSNPKLAELLYIWGQWRKFSIFSDPVTFAYNMVICSLICLGFIFGPTTTFKKYVLGALALFFLLNMLYSGTRGAYVLFPAALVLFGILNFNKRVLLFSIVCGLFIAFLIRVPTNNATLYRFQTAFKPSNDASFNVRERNQEFIQPYIQSHPMGGGLGSTGVWGVRFAPDSFLAKFPPDSGYVRVAVELGWIGLLIFCIFMFITLKTGIDYFYKIKDPELKSYCLMMLLIVFALNIGNYPQEAIVQYPSSILFYLAIALMGICHKLDKEQSASVKLDSPSGKQQQSKLQ